MDESQRRRGRDVDIPWRPARTSGTAAPTAVPTSAPTRAPRILDWAGQLTAGKERTYHVRDVLVFEWAPGGVYSVEQLPDKKAFDDCAFANATTLGTASGLRATGAGLRDGDVTYYACGVGEHCSWGQKLAVARRAQLRGALKMRARPSRGGSRHRRGARRGHSEGVLFRTTRQIRRRPDRGTRAQVTWTADAPTAAPSSAPRDAWHKKGAPAKDCAWVAASVETGSSQRCGVVGEDDTLASEACAACGGGDSDEEEDEETAAPTLADARTAAPAPRPTMPPAPVYVDWLGQFAKGDKVIAAPGHADVILEWTGAYDVRELVDEAAFVDCDFSGSIKLAGPPATVDGSPSGARRYFACSVGQRCEQGLKAEVAWRVFRAGISPTNRGDAAAGDVDSPRSAAGAAAVTWVVRRRRVAAT